MEIRIREIQIPSAFIKIDKHDYLIIGGPVIYIMEHNGLGYRNNDEIPPEHFEIIRKAAKDLWGILI